MINTDEFIEKLDMVLNDIKAMDSDDMLDVLDKMQPYYAKLLIEMTHRINNEIFSVEQYERMSCLLTNFSACVYDELNITKEQARKGNELIEKAIFDENR